VGKAWKNREENIWSMKDCVVRLAACVSSSVLVASCAGTGIRQFLAFEAPAVALTHVRVIDGTGRPARENQTVIIESERIAAVGPSGSVGVPAGARVLDLRGRTVLPGLVGMHDHLFYEMGQHVSVLSSASFAMLYLASGVTTIRTAGSLNLAADLRLKRLIDDGRQPGPTIYVSSPYLFATGPAPNPQRSAQQVGDWADQGVTSFKAYESIRRDELKAAIDAAHTRGLKVTGHLCAVGFEEAIALGIDNLEHGLLVDTEFFSRKQPDECPDQSDALGELQSIDVSGPAVRRLISLLVQRGVAVTSTLAIFETFTAHAQLDPRALDVLVPRLQVIYRAEQAKRNNPNGPGMAAWRRLLRKEMEFERAFFAAGGRLVAGVDPTGWGGLVAGFGNQREVELLVDAGLQPTEAIRVASANGAFFLEDGEIGIVTTGLRADLIVVAGDPSTKISDIRNVEIVFKNGRAYDPGKLIAAARGSVGRFDITLYYHSPYIRLALGLLAILVGRRLWRRFRSSAA
jgi:imidazolonepropionase-like amidohydrolase